MKGLRGPPLLPPGYSGSHVFTLRMSWYRTTLILSELLPNSIYFSHVKNTHGGLQSAGRNNNNQKWSTTTIKLSETSNHYLLAPEIIVKPHFSLFLLFRNLPLWFKSINSFSNQFKCYCVKANIINSHCYN